MAKRKLAIPKNLFLFCLLLGLLFDFLFWARPVGLSFPLFIIAVVVAGIWIGRRAGVQPAHQSWWLLVPTLFFSANFAFRTEPLTLFVSWLATMVSLALFAISFSGGEWLRFGFADYLAKLASFLPAGAFAFRDTQRRPESSRSVLRPIARGLLLVLPLLVVLAILLSSADQYFADWLDGIFSFATWSEYVTRGMLVLLVAALVAAGFAYALVNSKKNRLLGKDTPLVKPLLGFGEAVTMLASVNLLFAIFVAIQFRYFFGGLANIVDSPTALTYAEYARRGFGELVLVALISLFFFIGLSAITARMRGKQQSWFSGLGIFLFVMVGVILVSAFQRLLLLEEAYGFTRLRTYPHVFMIWLGLLLLAVVVLEARHMQRRFALATLLACLGFAATLSLMNVDAFITNINIARTAGGGELDFKYLGSLSADAVPVLASKYREAAATANDELAFELAAALVCYQTDRSSAFSWQSWNLSIQTANTELDNLLADPSFPVSPDTTVNTVPLSCYAGD